MSRLFQRDMPTPIGDLQVTATSLALRAILWPEHPEGLVNINPEEIVSGKPPVEVERLFARVKHQLGEYFDGLRTSFDLPIDPIGTDFQREVWATLQSIPYGETKTYGEQAAALGRPTAARAVGAANGRNPLSIVVPCHRVVGASGELTGFAGGLGAKGFLLDLESRQRRLW